MKIRANGILWMRVTRCLAAAAVLCLVSSAVQAAPIIYEPFSQAAGDLNGKAGGTGLSGNWSTNNTALDIVSPTTLVYGNLEHTGNQVNMPSTAGIWAAVTTTNDLATAGLLDDGATLWFSYVFQKTLNGGSNEHSGFAFGTDRVNPALNGLNMQNSGFGLGAYTQTSSVTASSWSGGTRTNGTASALEALGTPTLVIGRIVWGATAGDNEVLTLWTRALDNIATEPTTGGGVRTVAGFDQTQLNTISFGQRNSGGTQFYDEIRFGATYTDVAPIAVPEPSALALLAGGVIATGAALRRRRKAA